MSGLRETFNVGWEALQERIAEGQSFDPAGQTNNEARLRGMGKWRFILARGIVGFSVPMFLSLVLSELSRDIHIARGFHRSTLHYLFGNWIAGFCMSASLGLFVGLLAWRRLHSEVWPGGEPDPESSTTTLGTLSRK
jgi:hypothetical protein